MVKKQTKSTKSVQSKKKTVSSSKSSENLKRHEKDTGSPEAQILNISQEVVDLQGHLATHPKDVDAKRSLLKKVAKRRGLLKYLKDKNIKTYSEMSKKLNLKV